MMLLKIQYLYELIFLNKYFAYTTLRVYNGSNKNYFKISFVLGRHGYRKQINYIMVTIRVTP